MGFFYSTGLLIYTDESKNLKRISIVVWRSETTSEHRSTYVWAHYLSRRLPVDQSTSYLPPE